MIGIIVEYIGQIHEEVKKRPLFVVKELSGLTEKPGE